MADRDRFGFRASWFIWAFLGGTKYFVGAVGQSVVAEGLCAAGPLHSSADFYLASFGYKRIIIITDIVECTQAVVWRVSTLCAMIGMHTLAPKPRAITLPPRPSRHALTITRASATPVSSNNTQAATTLQNFKVAVFSAQTYVQEFMGPITDTFPNTTFIEVGRRLS